MTRPHSPRASATSQLAGGRVVGLPNGMIDRLAPSLAAIKSAALEATKMSGGHLVSSMKTLQDGFFHWRRSLVVERRRPEAARHDRLRTSPNG